jgi:hypothetical protein
MGIFRGPGGTGDATTDASNEATLAIAAAQAAELSKNDAANSAAQAATSASNASTSAGSASSSATSASNSASTASNQATNASNSASAAFISETNAANSASAALISETNAANLYDEFDDRYLGNKTSNPTLDNDGDALLVGALYWNTSVSELRFYDGTNWIEVRPGVDGDTGAGVVVGGTTGQALVKSSATNYDTEWSDVVKPAEVNTFTTNQVISTSSTFAALRVTQTGSGNSLLVEDSTSPDNTPFVVTNDGSVGVNILVPIAKLDARGEVYFDAFDGGFYAFSNAVGAWGGVHEWYDSDPINGVGSRIAQLTSAGLSIGSADVGSTKLDVDGQISGKFTNVGTNIAAQNLATNHVSQVTISAATTLTTTVPPAGTQAIIIIVTSGTVSNTVTFGTGFKSTGTLATGTVTDRRFVVSFVSDGTNLIECSRTVAIV